MASRKQMNAAGILSKRTGAQALAVVSGAPAEPVDTAPARRERTEPVTFQVTARHREALIAEAFRRLREKGGGRIDASEVLREVLDAWLAGGAP